jgi:zinc transporter ZupT
MKELLNSAALIGAVVLGGLIVTVVHSLDQRKLIKILLAFSGGFLLSIAFVHFLPELYASHSHYIGMYVLIGFLIQLFLEYFSGGIEHGHIHVHKGKSVPWMLFLSLSVHSFIEGIPLAMPEVSHVGHDHGHAHLSGQSLLMGILFHQAPVAIALMTLMLSSGFSKMKSWLILLLFSIMTPLGLFFGYFFHESIGMMNMDILLAIVVGMFLHISTTIIFESTENHRFNLAKLASILVGVFLALWV